MREERREEREREERENEREKKKKEEKEKERDECVCVSERERGREKDFWKFRIHRKFVARMVKFHRNIGTYIGFQINRMKF